MTGMTAALGCGGGFDKGGSDFDKGGGGDQNAVAAIGKVEPRTAAGRKPAGRRAKPLQALQPDGAVRQQPAREPRDLPTVLVGRPEGFFGKGCGACRAEQAGAGWIGPQDLFAVGRPQPGGQAARGVGRQSRIAARQPLKFRILHRNHITVRHRDRQPECRQR